MKKIIYITACLLLCVYGTLNAQFTKGGTYKNYEKYHITYDTIKTTRTVTIPAGEMAKVGYYFINVGPAIPMASPFTGKPNFNSSFAQDYGGTGALGGSTGVDIGTGGMYGLRGINKHLIRQIDLGIYQAANFTYLPWSYSSLGGGFSDIDYNGFMIFSTCLAPAVIINPLPDKDLHIDILYKLGLGLTFGGGMEYSGSSITSRYDIGVGFFHGPQVHFRYSMLMVGFEFNFIGDYGTMDYDDGVNYYSIQNSVPLNNFAIKIGGAF